MQRDQRQFYAVNGGGQIYQKGGEVAVSTAKRDNCLLVVALDNIIINIDSNTSPALSDFACIIRVCACAVQCHYGFSPRVCLPSSWCFCVSVCVVFYLLSEYVAVDGTFFFIPYVRLFLFSSVSGLCALSARTRGSRDSSCRHPTTGD